MANSPSGSVVGHGGSFMKTDLDDLVNKLLETHAH